MVGGEGEGLDTCPLSLLSLLLEGKEAEFPLWQLLGFALLLLYGLIYATTLNHPRLYPHKGIHKEEEDEDREKGARRRGRRALLATAHPDDEVMFFGPTVVNLLREGVSVYLLCFSYGLFIP